MISVRPATTGAAVAAVFLTTSFVSAQEYYVDPAGNDTNSGTSPDTPWQTLGPVEDMGFGSSGYTVFLKAGGEWTTGGLNVSDWTLTRYGDGANPVLVGDGSGWGGPITAGSNAVVDGITVRGQGSSGISVQGPNALVQNCEVDGSDGYLQLGFGIMGEGNLITGNSVHDLSGQSGDSGDMNTSGGAEAYMVMASDNEISYNSAVNCWGINETLGGAEGGCLEIVNGEALSTIENVRFHHNYCERSIGLFEGCSGNFQGTDAIQENHGIIRDSLIAYNLSVDAMWLYLLQPVNTDFYNLVFEHNTLVHTPANEDIPQGGASSFGLLVNEDQGYTADELQTGMVIVRNNLFFVTGGGSAMMTLVPDHYNNLFAPSAPMSWTLGTGEVEVSDPGLTADYRLAAGSPAIDVGSSEAWQQWTDYDGNAVPQGAAPDIGVSEYCDGADCAEPTGTGGVTGSGGDTGAGGDTGTGGDIAGGGDTSAGGNTGVGGDAGVGGATGTAGDTTGAGGDTGAGGATTGTGGATTGTGGATTGAGGATTGAGGATTNTCQPPLTDCGGACVDATSDGLNCGLCGNVCPTGQLCSNGMCSSACAPGLTQCDQSCVDLSTNVLNCGSCGVACDAGQQCTGGQCVDAATDADASQPVTPAPGDLESASEEPEEESGCSCSAPGADRTRSGLGLTLLLGLLALSRRRK
jgi:MYXO-CTERM domain-containing protein